jgi:hypothetical protein
VSPSSISGAPSATGLSLGWMTRSTRPEIGARTGNAPGPVDPGRAPRPGGAGLLDLVLGDVAILDRGVHVLLRGERGEPVDVELGRRDEALGGELLRADQVVVRLQQATRAARGVPWPA